MLIKLENAKELHSIHSDFNKFESFFFSVNENFKLDDWKHKPALSIQNQDKEIAKECIFMELIIANIDFVKLK